MNAAVNAPVNAPLSRMPALLGLALTAAAALWWLAQLHNAVLRGSSPLAASATLLRLLPLLQAIGLCLMLPELTARASVRHALLQALAWLAPAWPLLLLATATGAGAPLAPAGWAALGAGLLVPVGAVLRRAPVLLLRLLGVAAAALCWRLLV